jgi:hypothetical protein
VKGVKKIKTPKVELSQDLHFRRQSGRETLGMRKRGRGGGRARLGPAEDAPTPGGKGLNYHWALSSNWHLNCWWCGESQGRVEGSTNPPPRSWAAPASSATATSPCRSRPSTRLLCPNACLKAKQTQH